MKKRYWHIQGFDSFKIIYEITVPVNYFTERAVQDLLRTLVGSNNLNNGEIVGAYARKGTHIANDLLHVSRERPNQSYSCGDNPYFTARIIESNS